MSNRQEAIFTAHRDDDGRAWVTVDGWPDELRISVGFLEQADPAFVSRDGDEIVFRVTNGHARYRIVGRLTALHDDFVAVAVERELQEEQP